MNKAQKILETVAIQEAVSPRMFQKYASHVIKNTRVVRRKVDHSIPRSHQGELMGLLEQVEGAVSEFTRTANAIIGELESDKKDKRKRLKK